MAWLAGDNWRGYVTLVRDAFEEEKEAYQEAAGSVQENVAAVNEILEEAQYRCDQGEAVETLATEYEAVIDEYVAAAEDALVGETYHDMEKVGKERADPLLHKRQRFKRVLEGHGKLSMKLDRFRHRNWTLRDEMETLQQQIKTLKAQYVDLEDTVQNLQYVQDNLSDVIRCTEVDEGTVAEIANDLPGAVEDYGFASEDELLNELTDWQSADDSEDPEPAPSA